MRYSTNKKYLTIMSDTNRMIIIDLLKSQFGHVLYRNSKSSNLQDVINKVLKLDTFVLRGILINISKHDRSARTVTILSNSVLVFFSHAINMR